MEDVFLIHGNAMEIRIVKTEAMKIQPCAVSQTPHKLNKKINNKK